jgi:hypothetical protein
MHGYRGGSVKLHNCRGRDQAQIYAARRDLEKGAGSCDQRREELRNALSQGPESVFVFEAN